MEDGPEKLSKTRREYDWDEVEPAVAIIESIAELEGVELTDTTAVLDKPLQSYVDMDALETLLQNDNVPFVTLEISHYTVLIRENTLEVSLTDCS